MRASRNLRLWAMAGLSGAALAASALALVALNAAGSAAVGPLTLMSVAAGHDRAANREIADGPQASPAALARAAELSREAIAQYPYDTQSWLRLAYVDALQHGHLTPAGVAALQKSYDLVAVDPDVAQWRVGFALENSQALSRPLRASVKQEVAALWTGPGSRRRLLDLQNQLQNPAGRLSIRLWIAGLRLTDAK